jgi:hypothetical protein
MTLKTVVEQALDYVSEQEPDERRNRIYRELCKLYESICDKTAVAGIQVDCGSD